MTKSKTEALEGSKSVRRALLLSGAGKAQPKATPRGEERPIAGLQRVLSDVQTPVAALELSLAVLAADLAGETRETRATLRDAQRAARRIRQYIDHFVLCELFGEQGMRRRRGPVELSALLGRLVEEYDQHATAAGVTLELDLPADPVASVRADETILERVFQNLLEDSLSYLEPGGRVRILARGASTAEIHFCNDGPALSAATRRRIFARTPLLRDTPRALLGLHACKRAVETHGGTLVLEDHPDWSCCFLVRLPLASL